MAGGGRVDERDAAVGHDLEDRQVGGPAGLDEHSRAVRTYDVDLEGRGRGWRRGRCDSPPRWRLHDGVAGRRTRGGGERGEKSD